MDNSKKWTREEVVALYNKPLMDLLYEAATVHRNYHNPNKVQVSTLISIKGRLSGGLWILPTSRTLSHRRKSTSINETR